MKYILGVLFLIIPFKANAWAPDMWETWGEKTGLYSPHVNNCDSSIEVYITVGGGDLGFCMEKNQRSTAQWEDARQDCATDGKRLPEPAEWIYACDTAPTGLVDMTDEGDGEWVGNRSVTLVSVDGIASIVNVVMGANGGGNGCSRMAWGYLARNVSTQHDSVEYRCVR